jgi:hypothetical protein
MRCRFSTAAATGAALMLSACASNSIGAGGIDAATKAQLQQDVQTLTQAAQHRQYSGAQTALSTLNADLTAAHAAGKVTDAKLNQIRASAVKVFADLAAVPTTTPTVTVPASPSARPSPDQPKPGHGNGNGNDHHGGSD